MVRCSDCGFLSMPNSVGLLEAQNTDHMPRNTPVISRFCYKAVPGFHWKKINNERGCEKYMDYEPRLSPEAHFQLEEARRREDRIHRTTLRIGLGTIGAIVVTGVVTVVMNVAIAVLN